MVKVCGYIINDKALLVNGLRRGLGTDEDDLHKENTIFLSAVDLMTRGDVFGHARLVDVRHKKGIHRCIALACNDPLDPLPMADRDQIETLKKVLHTDLEPRWYTYA